MIDQLVATQGELFFGSWSSTFTGFIVRMWGCLSQGKAGSEHGLLLNTFYCSTTNRASFKRCNRIRLHVKLGSFVSHQWHGTTLTTICSAYKQAGKLSVRYISAINLQILSLLLIC
jgi:hypothetical protein